MKFTQYLAIAASSLTLLSPNVAYAASSHKAYQHRSQVYQTAQHTKNSLEPDYIVVRSGDTLWGLARKYHTSVSELQTWNHVSTKRPLRSGSRVVVGWARTSARTGSASQAAAPLSSRSESFSQALNAGVFGEQVAHYAQQFVGVPYQWGGRSSSGFDCSGLVQFSYGHFGITLGRSSYDQFQEGAFVQRADLLPGDLVFFNAYGPGASHVGIYLGNGAFVNAASGGVRVDSLYTSYWGSHYLGAKRISR